MGIKRSMSVRPAPIINDGVAQSPSHYDNRWEEAEFHGPSKWKGPWGYIVARVTNSTEYRPGFLLTRAKVNDLIEAGWTVSVLSNV